MGDGSRWGSAEADSTQTPSITEGKLCGRGFWSSGKVENELEGLLDFASGQGMG